MKEMYPTQWDLVVVGIDWWADRYTGYAEKVYAHPGASSAGRYAVIEPGQPLRMTSQEMKGAATHLFPQIEVLRYLPDGVSIRYGESEYTVTLGKPFRSDPKGESYTTFRMTVEVQKE